MATNLRLAQGSAQGEAFSLYFTPPILTFAKPAERFGHLCGVIVVDPAAAAALYRTFPITYGSTGADAGGLE